MNDLVIVIIIKLYICSLLLLILKTSFIFLIFISPWDKTGLPFLIFFIEQFFSNPDIVKISIPFSSLVLLNIIKSFIGDNDSYSLTIFINELFLFSIFINWLFDLFEPLNK